MSEESKSQARNSTVAISAEDAKRLERFCKTNRITKKDFISLSLSYFETQGINPAVHETPKAEIEKIKKRLDQFFAFMKKQEQDILRPMYYETIANSKNQAILVDNQNVLNKKMNNQQSAVVSAVNSAVDKLEVKRTSSDDRLCRGIDRLFQVVDEKNKSGLMGKLFK